jgi:hypothetical protein
LIRRFAEFKFFNLSIHKSLFSATNMFKFLVPLSAILVAVTLGVEPRRRDDRLASGILECSSDRSRAYLDVFVLYDRSLQEDKFSDVSINLNIYRLLLKL